MTKTTRLNLTGPAKLEDRLRAILTCLRPPAYTNESASRREPTETMQVKHDWAGNIVAKIKLVVGAGAGWKAAAHHLERRSSLEQIRAELQQLGFTLRQTTMSRRFVLPARIATRTRMIRRPTR